MTGLSNKEYNELISYFKDYLNENCDSEEDKKRLLQDWLKLIDREDKIDDLLNSDESGINI